MKARCRLSAAAGSAHVRGSGRRTRLGQFSDRLRRPLEEQRLTAARGIVYPVLAGVFHGSGGSRACARPVLELSEIFPSTHPKPARLTTSRRAINADHWHLLCVVGMRDGLPQTDLCKCQRQSEKYTRVRQTFACAGWTTGKWGGARVAGYLLDSRALRLLSSPHCLTVPRIPDLHPPHVVSVRFVPPLGDDPFGVTLASAGFAPANQ